MRITDQRATRLFIFLAGFFLTNALIGEFVGVKIFALEPSVGADPFHWSLFGIEGTLNFTAGVLVLKSVEDRERKLVLLVSIEYAKFRKQVVPGDQLRMELTMLKRKASVAKMSGKATVDGALVAEAEVMCKLADKPE